MRPPAKLDGAVVRYWAWSQKRPFFIMPLVGGTSEFRGIRIHGLAVCEYLDSGSIYRFSCDELWAVHNDSQCACLSDALEWRSAQFDASSVDWNSVI